MKTHRATHLLPAIFTSLLAISISGCNDVNTDTDYESVDVTSPPEGWELVWSDEFDGTSIDDSKWTHEVDCWGGGNNEQQCYTESSENSYVEDGKLYLVALPAEEGAEKPYTSARMNTQYKGDWKYGRIEIRAQMPAGQGTFPAFWMMPTDSVYGGWPLSGEIDILETVNLKAYEMRLAEEGEEADTTRWDQDWVIDEESTPNAEIHGTLHYGPEWPNNLSSGTSYEFPDGSNPADDFHTYAIEWQEGEIRWYADGYLYATQRMSETITNSDGEITQFLAHRGWYTEFYDMVTGELTGQWTTAPFDQEFYLILNNAVGGDWSENTNEFGVDADAFTDGQAFIIDYVRVYQCSTDPDTGAGCETLRAGYDQYVDEDNPEYALLEGEAPNPPDPSEGETTEDYVVFGDSLNADWPAWDCCGGTTPAEVTDDDRGTVVEFSIGSTATVMGFITRSGNGGGDVPYDGSSVVDTGSISFDLKVESMPNDSSAAWIFKIESDNAASAVELDLTESVEGVGPTEGVWQTYTYTFADLSAAGLDLSALDVIMVFPAWGSGEGAVYRMDEVMFNSGVSSETAELVLFEDEQNPDWPAWDCCGGSTPVEQVDDAEHGAVIEFSIGSTATVMGFITKSDQGGGDTPFDASSIVASGVVEFEMKVESMPNDADAAWLFKIESNDASEAVELNLSDSVEGASPTTGVWQTYTFNLSDLATAGLDTSAIDVVMIFPAWGSGEGAVYRIDNAKIYDPTAEATDLTLFKNDVADEWTIWDCCGGSTPEVVVDEDGLKGYVAEFSIGSTATVMGFLADDDVYYDASSLVSEGFVRFDMKVVSMPNDSSAAWYFKIESNDAGEAVELAISDSVEGVDPEVGVWQTYTFMLSDLAVAGLDTSAIDVVMIFPAWGSGEGAVYRIDNAEISVD